MFKANEYFESYAQISFRQIYRCVTSSTWSHPYNKSNNQSNVFRFMFFLLFCFFTLRLSFKTNAIKILALRFLFKQNTIQISKVEAYIIVISSSENFYNNPKTHKCFLSTHFAWVFPLIKMTFQKPICRSECWHPDSSVTFSESNHQLNEKKKWIFLKFYFQGWCKIGNICLKKSKGLVINSSKREK